MPYFLAFLLPIAATLRLLRQQSEPKSDLKEHCKLVNLMLCWLHRLELPLFRFNRIGGPHGLLPGACPVTEASGPELLSVIVPTYNEEEGIPEFHRRLTTVLRSLPFSSEIVYVNDGSKDGTLEILRSLSAEHDNVAVVDLSRNFGKEIALAAGLDHAYGGAVVVITGPA